LSVYTPVTRSQLEFFFDRYALGAVIKFEGISNGIDNSNYFVDTTQGSFVLTLFETLTLAELPHFINLMTRLANYHIPCPRPQPDKQANSLRLLNGKPAAVFKRLSGVAIEEPTRSHCQQVGLHLAELHDCTQNYDFPITNNVLDECKTLFAQIYTQLTEIDRVLIEDELHFQTLHYPDNLPCGVIHADLFMDNVLFDGDKLGGILDFYSAGTGALLLDLAITANDWCCDNDALDTGKVTALLSAYETLRPLQTQERQHWQTLLRIAALRFWLSRLAHQLYPRAGEIIQEKDPLFFRRLLEQHRCSTEQQWRPTFHKAINTATLSTL
jgi:homoserine kinase type II